MLNLIAAYWPLCTAAAWGSTRIALLSGDRPGATACTVPNCSNMQAASQCIPQAAGGHVVSVGGNRPPRRHIVARCSAEGVQQQGSAAASRRQALVLSAALLTAAAAQQPQLAARAEEAVPECAPDAPGEQQVSRLRRPPPHPPIAAAACRAMVGGAGQSRGAYAGTILQPVAECTSQGLLQTRLCPLLGPCLLPCHI